MPRMMNAEMEMLVCLYLDRKLRLIKEKTIALGGENSATVHPKEILRPAIRENSSNIIIVHNHPSGDPSPSKDDIKFTKNMIGAGNATGIRILDHVIIGEGKYESMKSYGLF